MKVDVSDSVYREAPEAHDDFSRRELRSLRLLLRRLQFLESQLKANEGNVISGGANFAEWESDALEFVLTEIGYLQETERKERRA